MEQRGQIEAELRRLGEAVLEPRGLELVDVVLRGGAGRCLLRFEIDRPGPQGVNLTDCQLVSRELSERLDRADPLPWAYVLEVSSPGLDRPIRSAEDFRRNTGRRVVVRNATAGREQAHRGVLLGCADGELRLASGAEGQELRIPLSQVVEAKQDVGF